MNESAVRNMTFRELAKVAEGSSDSFVVQLAVEAEEAVKEAYEEVIQVLYDTVDPLLESTIPDIVRVVESEFMTMRDEIDIELTDNLYQETVATIPKEFKEDLDKTMEAIKKNIDESVKRAEKEILKKLAGASRLDQIMCKTDRVLLKEIQERYEIDIFETRHLEK